MSASTSGRNVERASGPIRRTASSPASIDTPAAAYVSPTEQGLHGDRPGGRVRRAVGVTGADRRRGGDRIGPLGRIIDGDGVVTGEAGGAEAGARRACGREEPVERQV